MTSTLPNVELRSWSGSSCHRQVHHVQMTSAFSHMNVRSGRTTTHFNAALFEIISWLAMPQPGSSRRLPRRHAAPQEGYTKENWKDLDRVQVLGDGQNVGHRG